MNEAEKMGFVRQAQSELQQRIAKTNDIREQLKRNYSGYSSNIAQISLLAVLGFIISMLIWAMFNVDVFLKVFSTQDYARDLFLSRMALVSIILYISLYIYKNVIRILRIAKIDGHVFKIRNIEKYLQTKLNNIDSIAADADKLVFGSFNKKFETEYDVDADIAKYSSLVRTYSDSDNNWLGLALTIMHWLSGVFLVSVFLLISTPFSAEKISEWMKIRESGLIALVYMAFFPLLYMVLQELYARNIIASLHNKIKKISGILFIAGMGGFILYFLLTNKSKYDASTGYVFNMVVSYVPLLIGVVFSSIICMLCKIRNIMINIIYIICIYGILVLYNIKFNSFSIGYYGSFWRAIFTLCIPMAAAAFCTSIISVTGKIKNKTFGLVLMGIGAAYILTIILVSIGNNITEYTLYTDFVKTFREISKVIRIILIIAAVIIGIIAIFSGGSGLGGIIVIVICGIIFYFISRYASYVITGLIIFALIALIPLLPGLIFLLATSHSSERSRIISILLLVAISAAGFFIVRDDWKFSLPLPAPAKAVATKNATVISDALNVRARPSGDAEIVKILYKGDVVTITGDVSGGWIPVEHEGAKGWVSSEFIK